MGDIDLPNWRPVLFLPNGDDNRESRDILDPPGGLDSIEILCILMILAIDNSALSAVEE